MEHNHRANVPLGVGVVAGFYVLGACVLLLGMITNPEGVASTIAVRHGLPTTTGIAIVPAVAALALAIAYGLFTCARWGLYLTLGYLLYFGTASFFLAGPDGTQPYVGNFLWSALVVAYLLVVRKHFLGSKPR